jgi:hypothetical protein
MHPSEISNPTQIQWSPVIVRMPDGPVVKVCGPLQAFEILNRRALGDPGHLHKHAQRCCTLAMERRMSPDKARQAFVAATIDLELRAN